MSELKATPGPWLVDIAEGVFITTSARVSAGKVGIALCPTGFKGIFEDEQQANVHLIAAAPELYDALDNLIDACGHDTYAKMELEAAVAALAKARGEQ